MGMAKGVILTSLAYQMLFVEQRVLSILHVISEGFFQ
jgi:hypothetical protein